MKILIATGIYPPAIGGPAKYAEQIKSEWEKLGHTVYIKTFNIENNLPTVIRHLFYLFKIIPKAIKSDFIFALDTFSTGIPATILAKILGKKIIMRTGGDFLWENYVERTGELVLLRDFYKENEISNNNYGKKWSNKDKTIFNLMKWTFHRVDNLIFSTEWQKNIWMKPYSLENVPISIIENKYGEKEKSFNPNQKDFIASTRVLKWKNIDLLKKSFDSEEIKRKGLILNTDSLDYDDFMNIISNSYAVILVSLGDISPNMILDSIKYNKPFIITEENGLMNRIKDIAITINPKDINDIREKVLWLSDKNNYDMQVEKIKNFNFTHTYTEISKEILDIFNKINRKQ